ncbi:MAG TPA: hypothetical protein VMW06_02400 [Desulfobacterales bacterium]|nr:hypothetical protein [Desulfobacterales bacterium]
MKKKNLIMVLLAMVFTLSFISPSVWAGSPQQYRWEGVAIGVGAAVLGGALINACIYPCPSPRAVYRYPCPPRYGYYHPPRHHRGHWKAGKRSRPNHYKEARPRGPYPGHGR